LNWFGVDFLKVGISIYQAKNLTTVLFLANFDCESWKAGVLVLALSLGQDSFLSSLLHLEREEYRQEISKVPCSPETLLI
jgi:hypothetical protein